MNYLIAFVGGIITFISPCILPLIPAYISYITGISVKELKDERNNTLHILLNTLFFVLGFSIIFSILAVLFFIFFQSLGNLKVWFNIIGGIILIIFGLHIMGIINIKFLNYEIRYKNNVKKINIFSSLFMGIAFGAGWTPCVGPILSGILLTASNSNNPIVAITYLLVYSSGIGIPFIITGLAMGKMLLLFNKIKKYYKIIEIISGLFIILLGILLIFNLTGQLSNLIYQWFPFLGDIEGKFVK